MSLIISRLKVRFLPPQQNLSFMERKYKTIVIFEKRVNALIEEMNEKKINKEDIVYAGPTDKGYICIYLG